MSVMNDIDIYELEEILPELYGESPRRISHQSGILYAGVPLTIGWHISSNIQPDKIFKKHGIIHIQESEETLFEDAEEIAENTWLSSPERAIVEEAEDMNQAASAKMISRAMDMPSNFDWGRIPEVAEKLNYSNGLRRVCSMSDAMSNWEHTIHNGLMSGVDANKGNKDWIKMLCRGSKLDTDDCDYDYVDDTHFVLWEKHPNKIFEDLLT